MRQLKIVFLFEFMGYTKSKSFIITTVILALLAMALPTIPTIWGLVSTAGYDDSNQAVIVDTVRVHNPEMLAVYFPDYEFVFMDEAAPALAGLEDGTFAWVLEVSGPTVHIPSMTLGSFGLQGNAAGYIRELYRRDILDYYSLPADVVDDFFGLEVSVELRALGGVADLFVRDYAFAYVLIILLYITLVMYGQFITTSVVTEKSSKAMEILITAAKPLYLMFGKVLGVTAAGLLQLIVLIGAGVASFIFNAIFWVGLFFDGAGITQDAAIEAELLQMMMAPVDTFIFVYLVVFFLLGFLLYAFIYAAMASMASRVEDANTVQSIPIMLLVVGIIVTMIGLGNPGAGFITVLSYVPFFAPMLMLMRYIMGTVGHGGVMLSILLLALTMVFMGYLSAKIYRVGVLMYGKPPKFMEVVRTLFAADVG